MGVVPQDLDQVTAAAAKDEKMARVRVALEHFLHLERQPVHALAHVGAAGGQPDPRPARERDHRPASARSAAATTAGSAAPEMRTRSPPASSTSIRPEGASAASPRVDTGGATQGWQKLVVFLLAGDAACYPGGILDPYIVIPRHEQFWTCHLF